MIFNLFLFVLCVLGIFCSLAILGVKNPVESVFFLILVFVISSCLLFLLTLDFIAIIFIIVYVGAIAVLFLFLVMMLNVKLAEITESYYRYVPLCFFLLLFIFGEIYYLIDSSTSSTLLTNYDWLFFLKEADSILLLSNLLYVDYLYLFILAGFVLLLAMIGTISLSLSHNLDVKRQSIFMQTSQSLEKAVKISKK